MILITLLLLKHFIVDFLLQPPWMYKNKGILGHAGGIAHSGLHGIVTFLILTGYGILGELALELALLEYTLHYFIDYSKVNINRVMKWGPTTHEQFWMLLGLDQFLHNLTYILIIWIVTF